MGYEPWSPDSHYLRYVRNLQGDHDPMVRLLKVGDSHPKDLFSLKGLRRLNVSFRGWTKAAPDGSQMIHRDASGRDIYIRSFRSRQSLLWRTWLIGNNWPFSSESIRSRDSLQATSCSG